MRLPTIALAATTILLACPAAGQAMRSDVQTLRTPAPDRCTPGAGVADYRKKRPRSMKLGDQPPASAFYTVYNFDGRCSRPIVLRRGIGANPEQAEPIPQTPPRMTTAN